MSRVFETADAAAIIVLLSPERLATLTALTGSPGMAISLHQQTLDLNARLMTVIANVELALRNTISENLTAFFGTPGWLTHPPAPFQWRRPENENAQKALESARRSSYSKLSQAAKAALDTRAFPNGRPPNTSHMQRAKLRRRQIPVSDGKVIAETTFYFWKRLYSPDYEHVLWRPTLKRTFPNKALKRAHVAEHLEYIYQARNRLAHHEPVLHKRFQDAISGIRFVSRNLGVSTPDGETPLAKLISSNLDQTEADAQHLYARLDSFRNLESN